MAISQTYKAQNTYHKVWNLLIDKLEEQLNLDHINKSRLAEDLGVSTSTISRWLNRDRGVDQARFLDAIRIATYLKIDEKTLQNQLSENELRAFALISQLKEGKGMLLLKKQVQHITPAGRWKTSSTLENNISFNPKFLQKITKSTEENFLFTIDSNKMNPTITSGDTIMIAPSNKEIRNQKIYALKIDGKIVIARISLEHDELVLAYDSPEFENTQLDLKSEKVELIGRVIWMSREL